MQSSLTSPGQRNPNPPHNLLQPQSPGRDSPPGNLPSPGLQAHLSPPSQLPRLAEDQLKQLEENFQSNRNPSDLDIAIIAAEVGLAEPEVKRWFEHRLARWRQKQGLPANSRTIME